MCPEPQLVFFHSCFPMAVHTELALPLGSAWVKPKPRGILGSCTLRWITEYSWGTTLPFYFNVKSSKTVLWIQYQRRFLKNVYNQFSKQAFTNWNCKYKTFDKYFICIYLSSETNIGDSKNCHYFYDKLGPSLDLIWKQWKYRKLSKDIKYVFSWNRKQSCPG